VGVGGAARVRVSAAGAGPRGRGGRWAGPRAAGRRSNAAVLRRRQARPPRPAHLPQQLAVLWAQLELRPRDRHARHRQPRLHELQRLECELAEYLGVWGEAGFGWRFGRRGCWGGASLTEAAGVAEHTKALQGRRRDSRRRPGTRRAHVGVAAGEDVPEVVHLPGARDDVGQLLVVHKAHLGFGGGGWEQAWEQGRGDVRKQDVVSTPVECVPAAMRIAHPARPQAPRRPPKPTGGRSSA
jgi:hypothetical protein